MELLSEKAESNSFTKSETEFFGSVRDFKKNYYKWILKKKQVDFEKETVKKQVPPSVHETPKWKFRGLGKKSLVVYTIIPALLRRCESTIFAPL